MIPSPHQIEVALGALRYPIWIGTHLLRTGEHWRASIRGEQVLVVSNETVAPHYLPSVCASLSGLRCQTLILPDGETHKTMESVMRVLHALAAQTAHRDATVIALGGGVIGDLAGLAAALYMRGINVLHMPTSLLAQVDSSIGGKTAVNLAQGKNLIGAFHQPCAIVIDTTTLATLPEREFRAGIAEIVKYGAIADPTFFTWLEQHTQALLAREPNVLTQAIIRSCEHKAAIVMRDERELGERALLNFGHSFGHALETATGYTQLKHGEAVAIGMVMAAKLSTELGYAPQSDALRLTALLQRFDLPISRPNDVSSDHLFKLMQQDKKNRSGRLRLILWRGIGKAEIAQDIENHTIMLALERF